LHAVTGRAAFHASNTPVIWGEQPGYLYLQLRDFKSGARKSDIMARSRKRSSATT